MKKRFLILLIPFALLFGLFFGILAGMVLQDEIILAYYSYKGYDKNVYKSDQYKENNSIGQYIGDDEDYYDNYDDDYEDYDDEDEPNYHHRNPGEYVDHFEYDPDFEYVDLLALDEEELMDSIQLAIDYADQCNFATNHAFIYYTSASGIPSPIRAMALYDYNNDYLEAPVMVTLNERRVTIPYYIEKEGMPSYVSIVEHLSRNRFDINFEYLYKKYRRAIHNVITKELYTEKYGIFVNKLIAAYHDINDEERKYNIIYNIMNKHWGEEIYNINYMTLSDMYEELEEKIISPEALEIFESNFNNYESDYSNKALIVWAYSFWGRRKYEQKVDEIYNTLCAIRDDYNSMY